MTHILLLYLTNRIERMNSYFPDCLHHIFERSYCCELKIGREKHGGYDEEDANKECSADVEVGNRTVVLADVISKGIAVSFHNVNVIRTSVLQNAIDRSCIAYIIIRKRVRYVPCVDVEV